MYEQNVTLPETSWRGPRYEVAYTQDDGGTGTLDMKAFAQKVQGAGLIEKLGKVFSLAPSGKEFAQWIIGKGMKAIFFSTDQGEWGEPNDIIKGMREPRENIKAIAG